MRIFKLLVGTLFAASLVLPAASRAADNDKVNNFYGEIVHASVENVKVYDPKAHVTLSFILTPKFDQIFSADGKTTYQMKDLKHGQYVHVVYDQKALGARHADKIFILNNANMKIGTQ